MADRETALSTGAATNASPPSHESSICSERKVERETTVVYVDSTTFNSLIISQNKCTPCWKILFRFTKNHSNYYRLHFLYFFFASLLGGCFIYISEAKRNLRFIDAYFTSVSAMCVTGLSTVDFSQFSITGQIVTFIMILLGSSVLTSVVPQLVRWYYYHGYAKINNFDVKYLRYSAVLDFLAVESILLLVPFYFLLFEFSAFLMLIVYFAANPNARRILTDAQVNFAWFSLFQSVSAFNNAGFGLLPANLVPFDRDPFVLLIHSVLILAGNTGYPVFLRGLLWCVRKTTQNKYAGFEFLWRFPRQSFTHLFTTDETLALLWIIIALTLGETGLSLALDWDKIGRFGTPGFFKVIDAFFQATSTRTAGFQVTDLGIWNPGMLMVTIGAMYLSSYPLTVAIRSSNQEEEILYEFPEATLVEGRDILRKKRKRAIRSQAQRLLINDFSFIFLGMVLIQIIESPSILTDFNFTSFKVIFEVISAYGTVGLTMGYPGISHSFSGIFKSWSKLVLIGIMLLGRHRGLPDSVDKALRVPKEKDATVNEFDDEAVRVHRLEDLDMLPVEHKVSRSILSTAMFGIDADAVIKHLYTVPNLDGWINTGCEHEDLDGGGENNYRRRFKVFRKKNDVVPRLPPQDELNTVRAIDIRHIKSAM